MPEGLAASSAPSPPIRSGGSPVGMHRGQEGIRIGILP
jgi:hypothetical protein